MDEEVAPHIAAISLVIQDMVEIMHREHPEDVEAKLRSARLFLQEAQAGRIDGQSDQTLLAHRLRRDLLERAVARNREPE